MVFLRRWFLIGFALVLGGGPLVAASREERAYAAAVAAFNDRLYERAEDGLAKFLQTYRRSTNAPMAELLLAQSEFYLGNYSAAMNRLANPVNLGLAKTAGLADHYVYWRAEAQFASGDFSDAAQTFISLPDDFPNSPLALSAVVAAAAAYEKLGQWQAADNLLDRTNGRFQRAAQLDPASEAVANGRLLQSESRCAAHDFTGAIQILNLLNPATLTSEQDWKRAHQLYRAKLHLDDLDGALAAATSLLQIARHGQGDAWATNLAESVACRAEVLEKLGRLKDAIKVWRNDLTNGIPAEQQQRAVLKMVELTATEKNLADAEVGLENFIAQFPDAPAVPIALLTLGEFYLKDFIAQPTATNLLLLAQAKFDQLLAASTNGPLSGKAFLDRGWCHWLAEQLENRPSSASLADFQSAAQLSLPAEDLAVARFKMGDAQFALTNFTGALTNYQAVLADFTALTNVTASLGDRALYQILRVQLALTNTTGVDGTMGQLLDKFYQSAPAESGMLLAGQGFSDFGSPAKARAVFRRFESERADSPLLPQVAFAVGRTFEREQNWPAAVTNYQNWLTAYPTNDLVPQVEYARAWALSHTNEAGAFELFTNFISQFRSHSLAPLAHWWVADYYFRLGGTNLVQAELNYELIFQDFPTNDLAYPAQLMAGRAAMGRFGYSDASGYFVKLINTNCPADLAVQARFGYCEALRQMAASDTNGLNLQTVTNILAQLCPMAATNEAGALAWSEMGDCDKQLGALDAATNAYAQVLNSPVADLELRSRAHVGLGIVLEKKADTATGDAQMALWVQARDHYLDVLDSIRGNGAGTYWGKKAGLQALALTEKIDVSPPDQFISDLEGLFPQLKDSLEKKRLALSPSKN